MRRIGLTAALLAAALWPAGRAMAAGASQRGTSGAQFLQIEPGARPAGMGYAFAGVADDVQAVYYNPAGLGNLTKVEATGMDDQYFQGINYSFAALSAPLLSWGNASEPKNAYGVLGAAVYNLSAGNIENRTSAETAAPVGTFSSEDYAYALSYAYALADTGLALGASGKFIQSDLSGYNAHGFAADLGALYKYESLSLGAGLRNLGPAYGFAGQADPLPLTLFAGAGWHILPQWLVAAEADLPRDNNASISFGTEYVHVFSEKFSGTARAGYAKQNTDAGGLSGATFGAGLGYANFNFDFAFVPFGDLGNAYQYSIVVKF